MPATIRLDFENEADAEFQKLIESLEETEKSTDAAEQAFEKFDRTLQTADGIRSQVRAQNELSDSYRRTSDAALISADATRAVSDAAGRGVVINQQHNQVIEQQGKTMGDAAAIAAGLWFRMKLIQKAVPIATKAWKNHKGAILATSGAAAVAAVALTALVVAVIAVGAAIKGIAAVARKTGEAIRFLASRGNRDFQQLKFEIEQVEQTFGRLKTSVLEASTLLKSFADKSGEVSKLSGALQLLVENVDILVPVLEQAAKAAARVYLPLSVNAGIAALKQLVSANEDVLVAAGKRAALENQQVKIDAIKNKFNIEQFEIQRRADIARLKTLKAVNAALLEQQLILKEATDGTLAGSKKSEIALKNIMDLKRRALQLEQEGVRAAEQAEKDKLRLRQDVENALRSVEEKRGKSAEEKLAKQQKTIKAVNKLIESQIRDLQRMAKNDRLTRRGLESQIRLIDALIGRERELRKERDASMRAFQDRLTKANRAAVELEAARLQKMKAEAKAVIDSIAAAILSAKGAGGQGVLQGVQQGFSKQQVFEQIIKQRTEQAQAAFLKEQKGAGKIDQFGKAIGEGANDQRQQRLAQRRPDRQLEQIAKQQRMKAFRERRFGGLGDVQKIGGEEFATAQSGLTDAVVKQAIESGKVGEQTVSALKQASTTVNNLAEKQARIRDQLDDLEDAFRQANRGKRTRRQTAGQGR